MSYNAAYKEILVNMCLIEAVRIKERIFQCSTVLFRLFVVFPSVMLVPFNLSLHLFRKKKKEYAR